MILHDVNVLVYAHREEIAQHEVAAEVLTQSARSLSKFAVSELVLSGFLRIVSNSKIFKPATEVTIGLKFCSNLTELDQVVSLSPGSDHFIIFSNLVQKYQLKGKLVADAYHAALAIEYGCTWLTFDSDFARFKDELNYQLL